MSTTATTPRGRQKVRLRFPLVTTILVLQGSISLLQVTPLAQTPPATLRVPNNHTGLWIVELSSAPTADGGSAGAVRSEQAAFRRTLTAAGVRFEERFRFESLFNGVSLRLSRADANRIASFKGVAAVWPVDRIDAPRSLQEDGAQMATALAMTGADLVQNALGYTGAGVRVGVIDSGIDYDHPDLGGCFGAGCRVAVGWDFVGDAFNPSASDGSLDGLVASAFSPVPIPDPDPDDCNGHGTHVAGIVGANGAVRGVAPEVILGSYRVFGCGGPTTSDVLIAAMERALADNMHVVNMSIGAGWQWPQYPSAAAATRLVNAGVVVVASIGNSGASGVFAASAPAVGEKVIGVASFDNTHITLPFFTISPDGMRIGYRTATGGVPPPASGSHPMARTGTLASSADACATLPAGSLTGRVALVRRGTCAVADKALNAQGAGAIAVAVYNDTVGWFAANVEGIPALTIPVVSMSDAEGALIDGRLAAGAVTMSWTNERDRFVNQVGGSISPFSSYGLSPGLAIKPDIGAPGGFIHSTVPLEHGGYATFSGTSMSSPHVAGAAALLLQAKPRTPASAVRVILQNSADPRPPRHAPNLGLLDNVHRQGAGLLDIAGAVLSTAKIEPAALPLGEGEAGPQARRLRVENTAARPVTFDLSYVNALSTGGALEPSFHESDATVSFDTASVTVPAGGTAFVQATITPATTPVKGQYGGYIVFVPRDGGLVYRVPFGGFIGDYQTIQVLASTATNTFPHVTSLVPDTCTRVDAATGECVGFGSYAANTTGVPYTMTGTDFPYFAMFFAHQARTLMIQVYDVAGKAWHGAIRDDYRRRDPGPENFSLYFWDGTTTAGNKTYTVPNGQYIVRLWLLKPLGDKANPAHWETWTSPVITIQRP